jgi:hypothetical protein
MPIEPQRRGGAHGSRNRSARQREQSGPASGFDGMEQAILAIGIPAVIGTGALFIWVCLDIWYWMRRPDDDQ